MDETLCPQVPMVGGGRRGSSAPKRGLGGADREGLFCPLRSIQSRMCSRNWFSPILLQFRRNLNEVSTLAALRDALLPKLLSGEIRNKDAERIAGEVA